MSSYTIIVAAGNMDLLRRYARFEIVEKIGIMNKLRQIYGNFCIFWIYTLYMYIFHIKINITCTSSRFFCDFKHRHRLVQPLLTK